MNKFKKLWRFLGIIGLIATLIFFLKQPSNNEICLQQYEKEKYNFFNGIVTNKFINKKEHNYKTLILDGKRTIWMNWDLSGLYEFIQTNDSIIKNKGSYEVKLYRNSIEYKFSIDFGCDIMAQKLKD